MIRALLLLSLLSGCTNLSVRAELGWDGGTLEHWCGVTRCVGPQAEIGLHYSKRLNDYLSAHAAVVHRSYLVDTRDRGEELVTVGAQLNFGGER